MYCNDKYSLKIDIKLNNGVYVFPNESSSGKSWLCKRLKRMHELGEPVNAYTFSDRFHSQELEEILIPQKYKVILLDRFDIYKNECHNLIKKCSNDSIILIDCKDNFNVDVDFKISRISINPECIEVY